MVERIWALCMCGSEDPDKGLAGQIKSGGPWVVDYRINKAPVGNKGQEADPPVADIFVMNDRTSPDYCPAIARAAVRCEVRTDNGDTAPNHALSTPACTAAADFSSKSLQCWTHVTP